MKVLITVKSPPYPSKSHRELVCTAGLDENNEWIRLVPIPYRYLKNGAKFEKFDWIELDVKKHDKDNRFETYRPVDLDKIKVVGHIGTNDDWAKRKEILEPMLGSSLCENISNFRKKADEGRQYEASSLFFIKPYEITDFIVEDDDPKWKPEWQQLFEQETLFEDMKMKPLDKIPFRFSYVFKCSSECKGHTIKIEDWEIVELARNYLDDLDLLKEKVGEKYKDWMLKKRELYFFMGSTLQFHRRKAKNPYIIIGVFYPPIKPPTLF
ncbi:hypothetical protein COY07_00525 [Candidatus Peregrinibacteria bacterium CG_4_10_14_0_2_um_filter_43_11]|nr:MAG: hypothetical protein COY07_00525 [Candidatus Peregrinibacteria bacterium CG_4_10_14_0_2_um_filter_43_11]